MLDRDGSLGLGRSAFGDLVERIPPAISPAEFTLNRHAPDAWIRLPTAAVVDAIYRNYGYRASDVAELDEVYDVYIALVDVQRIGRRLKEPPSTT